MKSFALGPVVMMFALSACGTATTPSSGGTVCPDIEKAPPSLAYPVAGATGVPDGNFTLVIFNNGYTLAQITSLGLNASSGLVSLTLGPPPNPVPTPAVSPLPPAASLFGAPVPALAPATQYFLETVTTTTGVCGSTTRSQLGSFTTQ